MRVSCGNSIRTDKTKPGTPAEKLDTGEKRCPSPVARVMCAYGALSAEVQDSDETAPEAMRDENKATAHRNGKDNVAMQNRRRSAVQ